VVCIAAPCECERLFTRRTLWSAFAGRASLTTRTSRTTRTTLAAWAHWRAHVFQLFELFRREDLLQLRLRLGFEGGDLLLLFIGQVQLFLRAWRKQANPAGPAAGIAHAPGAAFAARRTLPGRKLIVVLRGEEARGSAEGQREEEDFCVHDVYYVFCIYCVFPAPTVCTDSMQ
jgi:hypothetical protein